MKKIFVLAFFASLSCSKMDESAESQTFERMAEENPCMSTNIAFFPPGNVQSGSDYATALANRTAIQNAIDIAATQGAAGLDLGAIDCFVEVGGSNAGNLNGIVIPNGFSIIMHENTFLRVRPTSSGFYAIFDLHNKTGVTICGGNLIGDRESHTYGSGTHAFGHLISIRNSRNITVTGTVFREALADGIYIGRLTNIDDQKTIDIKNCKFFDNRRTHIAITDGDDIEINGCQFVDAGSNMTNSNGIAPRLSINIEGTWTTDNGIDWSLYPRNIDVYSNLEKGGNGSGAFQCSQTHNVVFSDNKTEKGIGIVYGYNNKIQNNIIHSPVYHPQPGTLIGDSQHETATTYNNEISGNRITNFLSGVDVSHKDLRISNNIITNCRNGIRLHHLKDTNISQNIITSDIVNFSDDDDSTENITTYGLYSANQYLSNVVIEDNTIEGLGFAALFGTINTATEHASFAFRYTRNQSKGKVLALSLVKGMTLNQNVFYHPVDVLGTTSNPCERIRLDENRFEVNNIRPLSIERSRDIVVNNNGIWSTATQYFPGSGTHPCPIYVSDSSQMTITGNYCGQDVKHSIILNECDNSTVSNNVAVRPSYPANNCIVWRYSTSDNNVIAGNAPGSFINGVWVIGSPVAVCTFGINGCCP